MFEFINDGSITSVKGFKAAGIHSGIKKRKKDLALIYSELPCNAAGTFTLNKVQAAPIQISKKVIQAKNKIKAILVNSGNANACTGKQGYNDALAIQKKCSEVLSVKQDEVLVSSTGVIGQRMPVDKILNNIKTVVAELSFSGGIAAAEAILTTDLKVKSFAVKVKLSNGEVTIGGICKGSGMIMPNMATMLGFITTDANIEQPVISELLLKSVKNTFNKISVDGDTSTNDMVILLANGISGINIQDNTKDYESFSEALTAICESMAKSIVVDGEGATKLVTISILNAKTEDDADRIAKSIANSPLVKTAINGSDANWGRIISAAGQSGAEFNPDKVKILFDDLPVLLPCYTVVLDEEKAFQILSKNEITLTVDLDCGKCSSTWWTCDFSQEYIKINANYRT
jgi:glutamate N-acetyltransferase/amino-acid N-acetyltransferase